MVLPRPVRGHQYWEQQVFTEQHTQRRPDTSAPPAENPAENPASLVDHCHPGRKDEGCGVGDGAGHADRPHPHRVCENATSQGSRAFQNVEGAIEVQGQTGTTRV